LVSVSHSDASLHNNTPATPGATGAHDEAIAGFGKSKFFTLPVDPDVTRLSGLQRRGIFSRSDRACWFWSSF